MNELLDWLEFPTTDEIHRNYSVIWNVVPRICDETAERDDFEPSVRTDGSKSSRSAVSSQIRGTTFQMTL